MSHFKERAEKVCLNCNAELSGRFCHKCGQENREPRLSAWGLITHFFNDITHFDGKFFSTTGLLIRRPGLLPKEYIAGRRSRFLDPIRMYIFSSAIFFLIIFSIYHVGDIPGADLSDKNSEAILQKAKLELLKKSDTREDSLLVEEQFTRTQQAFLAADSAKMAKDSTVKRKKSRSKTRVTLVDIGYTTKESYDSAQKALPPEKRHGWLTRRMVYRNIDLNQRINEDEDKFWQDVRYKFVHSFPYLLFLSLPLYALYLKLLYIRRKRFFYVDHGLFLIFLYIFTFIFLLIAVSFDRAGEALDWQWVDYLMIPMFLWGFYYAWRAMHIFYGQGKFKTTIKFLLFNFLCLTSLVFLFALFFVLTLFSI